MMSRREREQYVETRAAGRCEYCRMHQSLQDTTFHVEHVIPQSRGGHSQLDNLAWTCPSCNLRKANRVVPAFGTSSNHNACGGESAEGNCDAVLSGVNAGGGR